MLPESKSHIPLLFLSSIRKRRFRKSRPLHYPKIPVAAICAIIGGKGMVRIQNHLYPLGPMQLFYVQPSAAVEVMLESDFVDYYVLFLRHATVGRHKGQWTATSGQPPGGDLFPVDKLPLYNSQSWMERIELLHAASRAASPSAYELQLQFQSLIYAMRQELPAHSEPEESNKGIDQSIGYMHKHYNRKIMLSELATIAGLTETSYSRSFKKAKGVTPFQYLNHIRIDSSKALLQQDRPIQEVTERVGFGNEFYFSRMFKRQVGLSPTIYIKRRQLRVGVASSYRYRENLRTLGSDAVYEMNGFTVEEQTPEENRKFVQDQLDALREAQPEIILADYRHSSFLDRLKAIAPTFCLDFTMDWRKGYWRIAELVGREVEARHNVDQLDQKISYARETLTQRLGHETVTLFRFFMGRMRIYGMCEHPMNTLLFKELGLKPGSLVPQHIISREYTFANLPPFETDHLLLYQHDIRPEDESQYAALLAGETWRSMKAVRNGQVRLTPNWIGMSWSPSGQNKIIDFLLDAYQR
ncbi:MAG: transcriptional regulator [Paenibacillus sp.]|jgi:AraC-like DNA-binding protein|nr:transcriptional regulator [Paenibacillus sp.]